MFDCRMELLRFSPYGYRMTDRTSSKFKKVLRGLLPIALLLGLVFGNQSPAKANAQSPVGGGGGFCSAEFQSCPAGGSWCTWYGWCGTGGGIEGGGGYGGGGYGGGSVLIDSCGPAASTFVYQHHVYIDRGSCASKRFCNEQAAEFNRHVPPGYTLQAICGLSRANPVALGRHLFVWNTERAPDEEEFDSLSIDNAAL
jgi:hypothetical protein